MSKPLAFLSYSNKENEIVEKLAHKLEKENVFYDKWNLDSSNLLASKLAEGVFDSKWFVILLSKNAIVSRWIQYEMNLALIRWIEDKDFQIIVIKIDDCEVPVELKPFVYINRPYDLEKAIDETVNLILSEGRGIISRKDRYISIIDRYKEIEAIEKVTLVGSKIILFWGIEGIGKSTLAEHAANKHFQKNISRFNITEGHDELRLALEMAAKSKLPLPDPAASSDILISTCVSSAFELIRQGKILFFNYVNLAMDDEGKLKEYFSNILKRIIESDDIPPIFLASTRSTAFDEELSSKSHIMKIGPLNDEYILPILIKWIKLADPSQKIPKREDLQKVVIELHGYPLAARLASYIIIKYSIGEIIRDLKHFKALRVDIANQLIGRSRVVLKSEQMEILSYLTIADSGLNQYDLSNILNKTPKLIRSDINELFSYQFIIFDNGLLQILPLMKDYFWTTAYNTKTWKEISEKIAVYAKQQLSLYERNSEEFVHYCSMAYRLFTLANKFNDAKELGYYFKGELRDSAIKLFHAGETELSLKYANYILNTNPSDDQMKFLKIRCLTRLEQYDEAQRELNDLSKTEFTMYKLAHAQGLIYKGRRQYQNALIAFRKGLDDRQDYLPLLRDYGDLLERTGNDKAAFEVLNFAYSLNPRDKYITPKYVIVLEKLNNFNEALSIMENLVITCSVPVFLS